MTPSISVAVIAAALLFAAVHLFVGRLRRLDGLPRSRWLSLSGGAAVSYIFLHLLPELTAHQRTIDAVAAGPPAVPQAVYLVALVGLTTFYGLERHARFSARTSGPDQEGGHLPPGLFWVHALSFAAYNLLVGYLLVHRERPGPTELLLYAVAMALHFMANDHGLRQHYRERYDRIARWLFAGAVVGGCALGFAVELPAAAIALLFAFLAGGVLLNVLKEELPEERESAFLPFLAGVAGYGLLMQAARVSGA